MAELFGRDDILAAILAVLDRETGTVLLEGPAGIGKTTLLDAAGELARGRGAIVLETRPAEAERGMALLGLRDVLGPVVEQLGRRLPASAARDLASALGLGGGYGDGAVPIGDTRLAIATQQALGTLAGAGRVVVAIDDVQWLDASSGTILGSALRRLRDARIVVVATRRTPSPPGRVAWLRNASGEEPGRLALEPLSVGALHRMIRTRLGLSLPRPTLIRIHEATAGNPLYALELARSLGRGEGSPDRLDALLPEDLATLLWQRVRRLSPDARDVLVVMALATRADAKTVARALRWSGPRVSKALGAAIEAGLVVDEGGALRLSHPLVGGVVRQRTQAGRRRELHRRLAASATDPDDAALHLALAATGPDPTVSSALEAAAERAAARGATVDAVELLERCLALTAPGDGPDRLRRRVRLAGTTLLAGDATRALHELEAIDIPAIADPAIRVEAVLALGAAAWYAGDYRAATELHEQVLAGLDDPGLRGQIHVRLAWLYEHDMARGVAHGDAATQLIDPDTDPVGHAFALLNATSGRLAIGQAADHGAVARGEAMQRRGSRWDESTLPINWAMWMDDWPRARTLIDASIGRATERGDETTIAQLLGYRAEVELWAGDLAGAIAGADAAIERAEAAQQDGLVPAIRSRRGLAYALAGQLAEAEADGVPALEYGRRYQSHAMTALGATVEAAAAAAREDHHAVDRLLTEATASADAAGNTDQPGFRFHSDHVDALVALGELDRAAILADRQERKGRLGPRPRATAIACRARAQIALARGDVEEARASVRHALEAHASGDVPLELARSLFVAGQVERKTGQRKAAALHLDAALASFERIGAAIWAARARAERDRLGLHAGNPGELTPSEERIAGLAATGRRNREIAAQLGVSEKTVEVSLSRAYDKLGIRTRAELGSTMAARARALDGGRTQT